MRALVIRPDGSGRLTDLPDDDAERADALRVIVGGWLETLGNPPVRAYFNEDGLPLGLPPNPRATELCRALGIWGAALVGPVVFLGTNGVTDARVPDAATDAWQKIQ